MTDTRFLADLNAVDDAEFVRLLGDIFEHSPWVAERSLAARPFASIDELHAAMVAAVAAAGRDAQLELLRAHPELAGRAARAGELTAASTGEQKSAGLDALEPAQLDEIGRLNREYRERFGFPFIIAVRDNTREQIFAEWRRRLDNEIDDELNAALEQVYLIARLRLDGMLAG